MTRKLSLAALTATAALAVAPAALGQSGPDAFERAVYVKLANSNVSSYPDAFQRALSVETRSRAAMYPDAFQRALTSQIDASLAGVPGDHHERIEALTAPSTVSVSASDSGVEWPQVGIGFGLGALLALGLTLSVRAVRTRELAH